MNNSRKLLLAGVSAISVCTVASGAIAAGNSASTSASASVTVFQPISITKGTDLEFGRVIRPSSGTTTYTVSATDASTGTSGTGTGGAFTTGGNAVSRATFTVNGEGGQGFNVTVPASVAAGDVTINLVKEATAQTLDGTLGATGTATFGVGGNVILSDTSGTGSKTGSFNVTVSYQ